MTLVSKVWSKQEELTQNDSSKIIEKYSGKRLAFTRDNGRGSKGEPMDDDVSYLKTPSKEKSNTKRLPATQVRPLNLHHVTPVRSMCVGVHHSALNNFSPFPSSVRLMCTAGVRGDSAATVSTGRESSPRSRCGGCSDVHSAILNHSSRGRG